MANHSPFPLMPPKSTELRMEHFDEHVYIADSTTVLYKFLDAMCGDGGAGNLKKEIFLQRLSGALDGIYGSALDYIFGGVRFLSRNSSESYSFNTEAGLLTSAQWDEVSVKDAAYRARIREFFAAASKGGTPEGIRLAVHAATSADCQVMESWRYIDNFGMTAGVGRSMVASHAATNLVTGHRVFFTSDNSWSYTALTNGPGGTSVQQNSLTVGIPNPSWAAAIVARPGDYHIDFTGGPTNVAISAITGPNSGTNVYTLTGTWPANSTGFPITLAAPTTESQATSYIDARIDKANWQVEQVRSRAEVTVVPHKESYGPREARVLREMLDRITPQDAVVTINPNGLAVNTPVVVRGVASDSVYYQVEKRIESAPELDNLPPPEMLAIDLQPGEDWLFKSRELAPYARFNITSEYGYYYLVSGGERSPIDKVTYSTMTDNGKEVEAEELEWYDSAEQYGPWTVYDKADSPDNYPGGKFGLTPAAEPALTTSKTPYQFPFTSQAEYVAKRKAEVLTQGGQADDLSYRLMIEKPASFKRTYTADLAIATTAPTRDSTVTSSWTSRRTRSSTRELRDSNTFIKS